MKKNIEVELRGPLAGQEYDRLLGQCAQRGRLVGRENRFLVDFSTFIEGIGERRLDVRTRITNGHVELVVKKGAFGDVAREEAVVGVVGSDPGPAFQLLALLGYRRGVACDRGIYRYALPGDVEIAIQDVRRYGCNGEIHSRFFEAEILCGESGVVEAERRLRALLDELGLRVFDKVEWNEYVRVMNQEANGVFDIDRDDIDGIRTLGQTPEVG